MGACNSNKKKRKNHENSENIYRSNLNTLKRRKNKTIKNLDPNDSLLPTNIIYSSRVMLKNLKERNTFINRLTRSEKIYTTKKIVNLIKFEKAVYDKINQYRKRNELKKLKKINLMKKEINLYNENCLRKDLLDPKNLKNLLQNYRKKYNFYKNVILVDTNLKIIETPIDLALYVVHKWQTNFGDDYNMKRENIDSLVISIHISYSNLMIVTALFVDGIRKKL